MTDIIPMEDWLRGKNFANRQEAESYILNTNGKISSGMQQALDSIFGQEQELNLEGVADFFEAVENVEQLPPDIQVSFAERLFNRLRSVFG